MQATETRLRLPFPSLLLLGSVHCLALDSVIARVRADPAVTMADWQCRQLQSVSSDEAAAEAAGAAAVIYKLQGQLVEQQLALGLETGACRADREMLPGRRPLPPPHHRQL